MIDVVAAVPIRSFVDAKRRLGSSLDETRVRHLVQRLAARTIRAIVQAGGVATVVTNDDEVARWADAHQAMRIAPSEPGLDAAAAAANAHALETGTPWLIVHADMPLISPDALRPVLRAAGDRNLIVPSHDGGTNVLGGSGPCEYSYGPASYHRHLTAMHEPLVHVDPRLALDVDTASHLDAARHLRGGAWLEEVLA